MGVPRVWCIPPLNRSFSFVSSLHTKNGCTTRGAIIQRMRVHWRRGRHMWRRRTGARLAVLAGHDVATMLSSAGRFLGLPDHALPARILEGPMQLSLLLRHLTT